MTDYERIRSEISRARIGATPGEQVTTSRLGSDVKVAFMGRSGDARPSIAESERKITPFRAGGTARPRDAYPERAVFRPRFVRNLLSCPA